MSAPLSASQHLRELRFGSDSAIGSIVKVHIAVEVRITADRGRAGARRTVIRGGALNEIRDVFRQNHFLFVDFRESGARDYPAFFERHKRTLRHRFPAGGSSNAWSRRDVWREWKRRHD